MKNLVRKLKSRRGFTLMEMLIGIVVMLLITAVILLTVQMSVKYYTTSVRESEAQVLCGSLTNAIKEELEYATAVKGVGSADASGVYSDYTYYSRARAFGSGCKIALYPADDPVNANHIAVRKGADKYYGLVGSKTYSFDLTVGELDIKWDSANSCFLVSIAIQLSPTDTTVLASDSFTVYPVNEGN